MEFPPTSLKESLYLKDELKRVSRRKKKEMEVSQSATTQLLSSELPTTNSFNSVSIPVTNSPSLPSLAPSLSTPFHPFEFENQRTAHPFFHIQRHSLYNPLLQQFSYVSPASPYSFMLYQSTIFYGLLFSAPHQLTAIPPTAFSSYTFMPSTSMTYQTPGFSHSMVPVLTNMPSSAYISSGSETQFNSFEAILQRQKTLSSSLSTQ